MITLETLNKLSKAKNVTIALQVTVKEAVIEVERLMKELAVNKLMGGKYVLTSRLSHTHGTQEDLQLVVSDDYNGLLTVVLAADLDSNRESYYRYSDFNLCYNRPNRKDCLTFIKDLPELLQELAAMCEVV